MPRHTAQSLLTKLEDALDMSEDPKEIRQIITELRKFPEYKQVENEDDLPENPTEFVMHLCKVANLSVGEIRKRYGLNAILSPLVTLFKLDYREIANWANRKHMEENG